MEMANGPGASTAGSPDVSPAQSFREAIRYWEPRRLVYNLLLSAVAVGWLVFTWPRLRPAFSLIPALQMAALALIANLLYSLAYLAELALSGAAARAALPYLRGAIWVLGTVLAIILENYWIADEILADFS